MKTTNNFDNYSQFTNKTRYIDTVCKISLQTILCCEKKWLSYRPTRGRRRHQNSSTQNSKKWKCRHGADLLTCARYRSRGYDYYMGYEIVFSLNCGIFNGNIWNSYLVLYMYMEKKSISLSGVLGSEFSDCDISYATAKVIIVAWLLDCHQATQPYHGTVQYTVVPR